DIPSPHFGLNFDPSHLIWQQINYLAPLAEFRDRIFHVHAKDARIDRAALDEHGVLSYPKLWHTTKIPGLGDVRWGAFCGALSDAGYSGHVAIEVEDRAFEGAIESRLTDHQQAPPATVHQGISRRYLASIEKKSGMTTPVDTRREETRSRPGGPAPADELPPCLDLSVLIPVYNEVENVGPLHAELDAVLGPLPLRYELIFVD